MSGAEAKMNERMASVLDMTRPLSEEDSNELSAFFISVFDSSIE